MGEFISPGTLESLPSRYRDSVSHAVMLFRLTENKQNLSFAPAFTPLIGPLEDASNATLVERLTPFVPSGRAAQQDFFAPDLSVIEKHKLKYYESEIKKLERAVIFRSPISPMGHLRFALEVGLTSTAPAPLFVALRRCFGTAEDQKLLELLTSVYTFRNKSIAHQERDSVSREAARAQLKDWVDLLILLHGANRRILVEITLQFRTGQLAQESGARMVPLAVYELPADREISLRLQVFFHKSQEWVEVMAEAAGAKSLEVQQQSDTYVQANILHSRADLEEQCTVRCPQTGESRTGRNACIECSTAAGTVRICC